MKSVQPHPASVTNRPTSGKEIAQQSILISFLSLVFAIIVTKTFISLIAVYRFDRSLSGKDLYFTYTQDLALVVLFAVVILVLESTANSIEKHSRIIKNNRVNIPLAYFFSGIRGFISLFLFGACCFFLLSGYIFYEWGGYLEPQHINALLFHGGGSEEFHDLFFRFRTLVFFLALAVLLFLSGVVGRKFMEYGLTKTVFVVSLLLAPIALSAWLPFKHVYTFKPSVQSPLVLVSGAKARHSEGDRVNLTGIEANDFVMEKQGPIDERYLTYQNCAQGMNVVLVVLESVRKQNVSLYGYSRDTMPFLKEMAANSLVFHNAIVTQPRSCKTMVSLLLGTYPDPRAPSVAWYWEELNKNADTNLLNTMAEQGYSLYFGTVQQQYGGDQFLPFIQRLSQNRIDRAMSAERFVEEGLSSTSTPDERDLARDLVEWAAVQPKKFFATIWTKHAHMPYDSPVVPFGTKTGIDKYDNNLFLLDESIKTLVTGLEQKGMLENTLLVVMGDHGQAFGEVGRIDFGHGTSLYDYSLRVPFLIYNPKLFPVRVDCSQRFQPKDVPTTLLYLLGLPHNLPQSINIFSKSDTDTIYLSNIFTDYKLGMIFDNYKFVYRPEYDLMYLFDLETDPGERENIIHTQSSPQVDALKRQTLQWYKYQTEFLHKTFFVDGGGISPAKTL